MNHKVLWFSCLCIVLIGCDEDEEQNLSSNGLLPNIDFTGCVIQSILNENFNPERNYKYSDEFPSVLEEYRTLDEISGDILRTYRLTYTLLENPDRVQIDTVFQYFGDYEFGEHFYAAYLHHYHDIGGVNRLDSVQKFYYALIDSIALQGTSYLSYNDYGYMFLKTTCLPIQLTGKLTTYCTLIILTGK